MSAQIPASPLTSRRTLWLVLGLLVIVVAGLALFGAVEARRDVRPSAATLPLGGPSTSGQGSLVTPPRALSDFTLPSQAGTPLALGELRGRVVLLLFGFTHCPDVCPTTLGEFKGVKRILGPEADRVAFVFVSVDSERDTVETLRAYVGAFDPGFIGLQGDPGTLARIGPEYDLVYQKQPPTSPGEYTVTHTATAFLIDQTGKLRVVFPYGVPADALSTDVRALLAQP